MFARFFLFFGFGFDKKIGYLQKLFMIWQGLNIYLF